MSEESAIDAIEEFVALAIERRRRPLSADDRERIEFLDELLREMIDGSRPAPRRIANPAPARGGPSPVAPAKIQTTTTAPSAPAAPSAPSAPSTPPPIQAPPPPLSRAPAPAPAPPTAKMSGALDDVMKLSTADKKKVSEIRLEDLPKSAYTPPAIPAFMADYFSDDMVPDRVTGNQVPTRVVNGDGERVDLSKEMRVLLGLERGPPEPARPNARAQGPAPSAPPPVAARAAAPPPPAVEEGHPVIVHLLQGGTRRGSIELFDPDVPELAFTDGQTLPFKEVLAVFFGVKKGEPPSPGGGQPVVVKLVNDKQVTGLTNDYEEGAMALTVVPEPRRGNIDRIWVPAWAVKGIEI